MTVFTPLWGYWAWRERSSSKSNKNTQSGVKKGSSYIIIHGRPGRLVGAAPIRLRKVLVFNLSEAQVGAETATSGPTSTGSIFSRVVKGRGGR